MPATTDPVSGERGSISTEACCWLCPNDRGDLLSDGAQEYHWDAAGRLVGVDGPGGLDVLYWYDGAGNRVAAEVDGVKTEYVVDPFNSVDAVPQVLVEETAGEEVRYLYGLDLLGDVQGSAATYYGYDALSVRLHLDDGGDVTAQYRYTPFGTPMGQGPAGYGFTGEQWDGYIKMLFLRARYYQPAVGRFASRDRWAGRSELPQSLDRWVYVRNQPLNRVDPSGNGQPDPYAIIYETGEARCFGGRSCYPAQFCTLPTATPLPPPPVLQVFAIPPVLPEGIQPGSREHQGFGPTEYAYGHQARYQATGGLHSGIDIDTRSTGAGEEILQAVCTGKVIYKGDTWGALPTSIVIRCEGTWLAVQYGHLNETSVKSLRQGDRILKGTHFGRPEEGLDYGHLHLEVRSLVGVREEHFDEGGHIHWRYNPRWLFTGDAWSEMGIDFGRYVNPLTGEVDPMIDERAVWAYYDGGGNFWENPEAYPLIWVFPPTPPPWR